MRCPTCSAALPGGARFCPSCGAASHVPDATAATTRTSVPGSASERSPSFPSDDRGARFTAGTILAERYRIVGLLGRGGMGEVYRADDLKLGRTIALKFLPEAMERDPARLVRFLNEVRTAVRVTHPNVCRVHDVGEFDGRHYLSMEYVDGEDLGTLLRRIGRLPGDRAVRAARQLCAGLSAAHAQGVLHRDLKPGNVMIDGRGEVKITDFGLAGAIGGFEGDEIRVGTPAYMAPEQVEGRDVTVRSDLYALGLVLYEMFSGKAAFEDRTPDGIRRRSESGPPSLTTAVDDVDPAVARVVERCLSPDPEDRPPSAMAVAASLPGGDPLAAALAAGETPSPELVAEAGASGGLRARSAVALLLVALAGIGATAWLSTRTTLAGRTGLGRSNAVLCDRAESILRATGYDTDLRDRNHDWVPNLPYYHALRTRDTAPERWDELARTTPGGLLFVYRASPDRMKRISAGSIGNWTLDPPLDRPGMVEVVLDPSGRLDAFRAVPEKVDDAPGVDAPTADFGAWFEAAGLDPEAFAETVPTVRPPTWADRRYAWAGRATFAPGEDAAELRVEAASVAGRPVSFRVLESWDVPSESQAPPSPTFWGRASGIAGSVSYVAVLLGAAIVAARNVRLGRGDHRGALRFGLYLAAMRLAWLLGARIGADGLDALTAHLAWSAYRLCLSYVFYLALEPYARRLWPEMLVSWVRVFAGRVRDARVGRDVLIAVAAGSLFAASRGLFHWLGMVLVPSHDGLSTEFWSWESLRGVRAAIVGLAGVHVTAVLDNLIGVLLFLVVRVVTGSTRVAVVATSAVALVMYNPGSIFQASYLVPFGISAVLFWTVLFRAGLLAILVAGTVDSLLRSARVTADLGAWHALPMWLAYGLVLATLAWGFHHALAGRPLFRDEILRAGNR